MLYSSALFTWSLVTFISLKYSSINIEFFIRAAALLIFIVLFSLNIFSDDRANHPRKVKIRIAIEIILVWFLIYYDHNNVAAILLVLIATQLGQLFSKRRSLALLVIINVGYFLLMNPSEQGLLGVVIFFFLQLFAYSSIEIMIRAEQAKEKISEINKELLATRFMLKESSQRKERLRISRDLHDVIGHQLTALSLNLEVSCHKVSDEFKPMLQGHLKQAKTLLSDVREVVKEMRDAEQFDLIDSLSAMVEQLPDCQLTVEVSHPINSLALKQQLLFCLQEGITNALKHGKAEHLILNITQHEEKLMIALTDNGTKAVQKGNGHGLVGMKERLLAFNGEVELIPNSTGFTLKITVEDYYD